MIRNEEGAEPARRWRDACRWPTSNSEKLKFNFSQKIGLQFFPKTGLGYLHLSCLLNGRLLSNKTFILRTIRHLSLFELHSLYLRLVKSLQQVRPLLSHFLLNSNGSVFFQAFLHQIFSAIPFLKMSLFFLPLCSCSVSPSTANTVTLTSFGGRKNVNRSLLTGFVEIFRCKRLGEKLQVSSLKMKELLR